MNQYREYEHLTEGSGRSISKVLKTVKLLIKLTSVVLLFVVVAFWCTARYYPFNYWQKLELVNLVNTLRRYTGFVPDQLLPYPKHTTQYNRDGEKYFHALGFVKDLKIKEEKLVISLKTLDNKNVELIAQPSEVDFRYYAPDYNKTLFSWDQKHFRVLEKINYFGWEMYYKLSFKPVFLITGDLLSVCWREREGNSGLVESITKEGTLKMVLEF